MSHRRDLNNDLSSQERSSLVSLILDFLNDSTIAQHTMITHSGLHLFTGHRQYIERLENFLNNNGGAQFVPLPMWNPVNRIPDEFNIVKARDNGTLREPLENLNPNLPLPSQFTHPAVCQFFNGTDLGNAVNPWHSSVHVAIGGAMADFPNASAAPIFWCWHAFVDHIYWDWQNGCKPWQSFELAPAESANTRGSIAAVSRIPNSMEVWWIGADGSVQGAYWYEGAEWWKFYELAPAGSANTHGSITAVSRIPNSMEVWWIGANGSVQGAYWYEGAEWWKFYELAPAESANTYGSITAVSRIPNSMEVWWIGANGSVQGAYWYEGAEWWKFYELAS
ncbi:hypothetical protein IK3_05231, partial [Bacillus toyonensis]